MTSITRNRANVFSAALALMCLTAAPLLAEALALPSNARLTREVVKSAASYSAPVAPYAAGLLPVFEVQGRITKQAYRIPQQGITPQQILTPIEESLVAAGFDPLFKCQDRFCGGFDFRFSTDVLPAPDMFVDLFDYIFLTARRMPEGGAASEYISLLVSRDSTAGYVQIIQVTPEGATPLATERGEPLVAQPVVTPRQPKGPIGTELETRGHAVLSDLTFETGSSDLGQGAFASLEALATYLRANPTRKVALVGHTDTVGSLSGNIALSKRRATSVMQRLASAHGIPAAQMEAEGMGYLSPVVSNLTDKGREANRRVEVVLLSTE
ncbi:MAG: OmpA family protein [Lentibacter algarum]|uniref:OmpA family protein n=1 Tax=Lentibacter algarum TaxID=576131 RepID=UPI003C718AC2